MFYVCKKVFLETYNFIKKRHRHGCFPVNFVKFLRAPFFTEHLWTTASVCMETLNQILKFRDHPSTQDKNKKKLWTKNNVIVLRKTIFWQNVMTFT